MQKVTPHLWFDTQAREAAEFYVSVFEDGSKIKNVYTLDGTPSGSVEVVSFELMGLQFEAISAGPLFKFNPSISFSVACESSDEVNRLWNRLLPQGKVHMELGAYPFSELYGWLEDKYGLSWQLIAMGENPIRDRITPTMLFVGDVCGKAEEAMGLYTAMFKSSPVNYEKSEIGDIHRYGPDQVPDKEGTVAHGTFTLAGQGFFAMDSAQTHEFKFNEAISFMINCKNQEEIDHFWKLSTDPNSEQCGWLKDKFGFSWQVAPEVLNDLLQSKDQEKVERVTQAFLKMKKFDIKELKEAARG